MSADDPRLFPWRSLLLAVGVVLLLALLVAGGAWMLAGGAAGTALGLVPPGVHIGGPATEDEKRVAEYMTSDHAVRYEWVEFGPDDDQGLTHFDDPAKRHIVRVAAYVIAEGQPKTFIDLLHDAPAPFPARTGSAQPRAPEPPSVLRNRYGRDWLAEGIKAKKKAEEDAARRPRP